MAVETQTAVEKAVVTKTVIQRTMDSESIANDIASRFTGKLIKWGDLFDPQTNQFLTEDELTSIEKQLTGSRQLKT